METISVTQKILVNFQVNDKIMYSLVLPKVPEFPDDCYIVIRDTEFNMVPRVFKIISHSKSTDTSEYDEMINVILERTSRIIDETPYKISSDILRIRDFEKYNPSIALNSISTKNHKSQREHLRFHDYKYKNLKRK